MESALRLFHTWRDTIQLGVTMNDSVDQEEEDLEREGSIIFLRLYRRSGTEEGLTWNSGIIKRCRI